MHNILSPRRVEGLIAAGHIIVIREGRVLQLDRWIAKHPGGQLAVMHMVGRDATNEINVYHSPTTLKQMNAYSIGRIKEPWTNLCPPIRGGVYRREVTEGCAALEAADLSDSSTDTASDTSTTGLEQKGSGITRCAISKSQIAKEKRETAQLTPVSSRDQPHVAAYIAQAEQDEIDIQTKDYPSLDAATQQQINLKYHALHERVKDEGFYDCRYVEYGKEVARYAALFAASMASLHYGWYLTSAAFLGLFWHQIMFTAHDAGHRGITHNFVADTLIGMFIGNFCCGLSIGWWKSSHNVHHLITNHPEHDPDIQNVPLFATSPSFFKSIHSTYYDFTFAWDTVADLAVKYQAYTYYPVMGVARFNLYILSVHHLLLSKTKPNAIPWVRPTELAFIVCYWFLFGYCLVWHSIPTWPLRVAFVLTSHIITMPLHVQITLSHWGMPTADLGETESFPQRQLRTTMDVECPAWLDFIHGGLQFQAVHHLFPRVPRHNLRRLQVLVREFCEDTGIEYKILGFVDGNREVIGRLGDIGRQAEMMLKCQKYMAETGESGLF